MVRSRSNHNNCFLVYVFKKLDREQPYYEILYNILTHGKKNKTCTFNETRLMDTMQRNQELYVHQTHQHKCIKKTH
ncbi:unnamed protein product [Sphenostylis stenocarpa]|uniref:Uncharacterized protein n=1 Tax=Sphenostylis stenocarpa TaxID=92480 RepID=A0AA86TDI4_9FABA|nr:unnamed protein product [Sphenostylis stenocarpa]